jgi:hypothetical protein
MQIDQTAEQWNDRPDDCLDYLPDEARAMRTEAAGAGKAYSCMNFVHWASGRR